MSTTDKIRSALTWIQDPPGTAPDRDMHAAYDALGEIEALLAEAENQLLVTETTAGYERANVALAARIHAALPNGTETA